MWSTTRANPPEGGDGWVSSRSIPGKRPGFSLIELTAAIIVIGVAFLAVPAVLQQSGRSVDLALNARGLYHGLAMMEVVRNKPWDEANVGDMESAGLYYVLTTDESIATPSLACSDDKNRSGHYPAINRRQCEAAFASAIGQETALFDDMDDYDGYSDIPEGYEVNVSVRYVTYPGLLPAPAGTTTNLKEITVTVTNGTLQTHYTYYGANIGTDLAEGK